MFETDRARPDATRPERVCAGCGKPGRPLERIVGYPTQEAWDLVDAGEAVIKGCMVDPADLFDYECPHCGRGTDGPRVG